MVLTNFEYYDMKNKKNVRVKKVSVFSSGLMFRKHSPPLLFTLKNETPTAFTSIFCKKFYMIVLDKNKNVVDKIYFNRWKWKINCRGMYFIEFLGVPDDTSSIYRNI